MPGRDGGLLNARLRYFDPDRRRAGVPEDVAALVSELSDTRTTVTLVNLSRSQAANRHRAGRRLRRAPAGQRDAWRQDHADRRAAADGALEPGCGETLVLAMKRYANAPTVLHPWHRH